MSTQLMNNKRFSLTEYCGGKNKVMYQITQKREDGSYHYVQVSKQDICDILHRIIKEEMKEK